MVRPVAILLALVWVGPAVAQPPAAPNRPAATPALVAEHLKALGYRDIHDLRRGPEGQWTGKATRNGVDYTVTSRPDGSSIAR